MNENQSQSQSQGVQISIQDVMKNFAERKAKGNISWDTSGPVPVLVVEVFDVSGQKQEQPVRMAFSSKQVEKISLDYDDQITARKRQKLDIEEQIETLEAERSNVYGVLSAELKKLEQLTSKAK